MIQISVNSASREVGADTIDKLVTELGLPAPLVLVEHNGNALRRHEWPETPLQNGDGIEILRISAGG